MFKRQGKYLTISLVWIIVAGFSMSMAAQPSTPIDQFLRIDNIKNAKTKRLYIGQQLRYKEVGEKWRKAQIEGFDFIQQVVMFSTGPVRLKDIAAIQTMGQYNLARFIKWKLMVFGGGVLFYSLFNPIAGLPYPLWALPVGGGSIAVGYLAGSLLNLNYYRIGDRWQLKMLDLSFK